MYTYGPVLSRRLGYSLGIDLVKGRACTINCIYCQIGTRPAYSPERVRFFPPEELETELREKIEAGRIDYITFAGTGEPTLSKDLGRFIKFIKEEYPKKRIAVLTNGSLLWHNDVRSELMGADLVVPSLDAPDEETWKMVNRPHPDLNWDQYIDGLVDFSREFKGTLRLEIMLLKGINDSDEHLIAFRDIVTRVDPDSIDINTPVRPPAEKNIEIPEPARIERAKQIIGGKPIGKAKKSRMNESEYVNLREALLDFLSRRPETLEAIHAGLGVDKKKLETVLFELIREEILTKNIHEGSVFYWKR